MSTAVSVTLQIGWPSPSPLSGPLANALESVEVTQTDDCPGTFKITFAAERTPDAIADYPVLAQLVLAPGTRVAVTAQVGGGTVVLMEGYTTRMDLQPSNGARPGWIIVSGEDLSVAMSLYQYSVEYPLMPDFAIAGLVLAKWLALGIVPMVMPTANSCVSFTNVPQQASDDRTYLKALAADHGNIFCIIPGASLGISTAYWGPPLRYLPGQPCLSIDLGSNSTVSDISFCYDGLQSKQVWGLAFDITTEAQIPIPPMPATRLPPMASRVPTSSGNASAIAAQLAVQAAFTPTMLFDHAGMDVVTTLAKAQAITDMSSDRVVVAKGELDGMRYGNALTAPGVVALRGAGQSFNGDYYVQSVTHRFDRKGYNQEFTLTREGVGSLISMVVP